jgi:hypothetical protein
MAQPLEYEQAGYNAPDGLQVGRSSTETLGFYGTVPIGRPVLTGSVSSNACVSTIVLALANLGIVTNSTAA